MIVGLLEGAAIAFGAPIFEWNGEGRQPSSSDGDLQEIIDIGPDIFSVGR
jgi:hypothetical protein